MSISGVRGYADSTAGFDLEHGCRHVRDEERADATRGPFCELLKKARVSATSRPATD
jgi:hypothetical protein